MSTVNQLQLVLVTPEKTLLNEPVQSLQFPLFDGQIGLLPGRAPLVGRLGYGTLKIRTAEGERLFYIDGGFVQVKGSVVSLLTNRALTPAQLDRSTAEQLLNDARATVATTPEAAEEKERNQERARRMLALAAH